MIPLYKPHMPPTPALNGILNSGQLAYGTHARAFEERLGALAISNFGAAVTIALLTLGIGSGDEIIASPMSCLASTQPLLSTGAKVVWAGVDPALGILCPESVKAHITPRTKLIVLNYFCSIIGHVDEIRAVGRAHGIPVAEDVLEGFGGMYKGRPVGALCDVSWTSFSYIRLPQALDGAALWFADKQLLQKATLHRDMGIDRGAFRLPNGEIDPLYDITTPGLSAAMGEVQAYIGSQSLTETVSLVAKQRANATRWDMHFKGQLPTPITNPDASFSYWVYPLLSGEKEKTMTQFRSAGFAASGVHASNHRYSLFGKQGEPPGVLAFESQFMAIPCGWWMDAAQSGGVG